MRKPKAIHYPDFHFFDSEHVNFTVAGRFFKNLNISNKNTNCSRNIVRVENISLEIISRRFKR